ncbi:4-(cytidine 5'-diphospho)-2-C-methyl-D-erythritol kinase [Aestuariivirga sp.]|uniref:4-(cytidine 5'-diphospho)-2-C-methyl-D-erythritol kinase n=1 Tax=Aestuariivirga sp. TaxID=2650926 RepID=UPI003BA97667
MTPFSIFAPAKVNLALHVLGRRADGYHELDSIVTFADVGDWLTFSEAGAFAVTATGPFAAALPSSADNIIAKSWAAAQQIASLRGKVLPPVSVGLEKNLPVASGIGGGSANAAAALKGFLRIAGIEAFDQEAAAAGLAIGADVPVCLMGRSCRMQGVGERIAPLANHAPVSAILVNPLVEVSTPAVFRGLGLEKGQVFRESIADEQNMSTWRNDLAAPAIALAPVIGEVLNRLAASPGITRAFMSGSGATCVGIMTEEAALPDLDPRWWAARTVLG